MSDNRRNRINLLNKDCFRTTSALTGIFSVLGKSSMGVTCAEPTAIEPRRSLRDLVVGHTARRFGGEPFQLAGGAKVMILPVVDLFKAEGITAMFCDPPHANTKSAPAHASISSLMDGRRGFRRVRSMTAPTGSAAHALPMERAQPAPRGAPREQG